MNRTIPEANGSSLLSSLALTRAYLRDPLRVMRALHGRHGPVVRLHLFGRPAVVLLGADANELVLRNSDDAFSSAAGWDPLIGRTFPNGLISLDGTKHRADRRLIGAAFKPEPMHRYSEDMSVAVRASIRTWPERLRFYPQVRRLTLELASRVFLGLELGRRADRVARDFEAMLPAATALLPAAVPGGLLRSGISARQRLHTFLKDEIAKRRHREGRDIFTTICQVRDEAGRPLPDTAICDHVSLLLMAAHDTTTSALTSAVYRLGAHPAWQDALRAELGRTDGEVLETRQMLARLPLTDMFLSENLRCAPPVPSLPRGLLRDVEYAGHCIPAGTAVGIHILHTHHLEELWPDPDRFDPHRFAPEQVRARHRYAWLPFGGGMHMCLGLHFAQMQMKIVLAELLRTRTIELEDPGPPKMQWLPIAKPKKGLPVRLEARRET
jgi:cytochrome P450